ncbi:hypothetical protein AtDm6_2762 [Acetobacter tropicalis]|uniref:Uncharacterized protein n=1 Tax=Acetobacter tropicalis TaxID=104102 RepID=A0A095AXP2_9PROT|nr:hypothetical protein AtDm6_2762 [Acetobacter tropicalis]
MNFSDKAVLFHEGFIGFGLVTVLCRLSERLQHSTGKA